MRFLNDKFFRMAVVVFLLLMILPFIFSTPRTETPEEDTFPFSEGKTPIYKAIDKIARFYGFKKQEDKKDSSLRIQTSDALREKLTNKKEETTEKQNLSEEAQTQQNALAATAEGSTAGVNSQKAQGNNYITGNTPFNPAQKDYYFTQEGKNKKKQQHLNPKGKYQYYAKAQAPRKNSLGLEQEAQNNTKKSNTLEGNTVSKNTKTDTDINYEKKNYSFDNKRALKGNIGRNSFSTASNFNNSGSNRKDQDIYQSFDNSVKNITNIKLSQKGKTQKNNSKGVLFKTYKTEIYNPKTGKKETFIQKEPITEDTIKEAEELKQIAENALMDKDYNTNTINTNKEGDVAYTDLTNEDGLSLVQEGAVPPHGVLGYDNDDIDILYKGTQKFAEETLPQNEPPLLEVIYQTKDGEVLNLDDNNFIFVAVQKVLANRVQIPADTKVNFENAQTKIYVVPEEETYTEYKTRNIPVIYYPQFLPTSLPKVYATAMEAVNTYNINKQKEVSEEQDKNKEEIVQLLGTKK